MRKLIFLAMAIMVMFVIQGCATSDDGFESAPFGLRSVKAPAYVKGDTWTYQFVAKAGTNAKDYKLIKKVLEVNQDGSFAILEKKIIDFTEIEAIKYYDRFHQLVRDVRLPAKRDADILAQKRVFNFPLWVGKNWDTYYREAGVLDKVNSYHRKYNVAEFEDLEVQAGEFETIKVAYTQQLLPDGPSHFRTYWYSEEVKAIVLKQTEDGHLELLQYEPGTGI